MGSEIDTKMTYDQETRDLARLASARVMDAINSVLQICDSPDKALQVALMAAGTAMGSAAGAISAKYGYSLDEAKAVLPELLLGQAQGPSCTALNGADHEAE